MVPIINHILITSKITKRLDALILLYSILDYFGYHNMGIFPPGLKFIGFIELMGIISHNVLTEDKIVEVFQDTV